MFSRNDIKLTAWATLFAILFVVLLPAAMSAVGTDGANGSVGKSSVFAALAKICTLDGAKVTQDAPDQQPLPAAHKPCLLCITSVPIFADANAPRMTMIDGIPVIVGVMGADRAESLPPDVSATQPLSPRAPPRLN